jgi:hypothetical protein
MLEYVHVSQEGYADRPRHIVLHDVIVDDDEHPCGTIACVAGFCAGFFASADEVRWQDEHGFARDFLGMSEDEAHRWFETSIPYRGHPGTLGAVTFDDAKAALRGALEKGSWE